MPRPARAPAPRPPSAPPGPPPAASAHLDRASRPAPRSRAGPAPGAHWRARGAGPGATRGLHPRRTTLPRRHRCHRRKCLVARGFVGSRAFPFRRWAPSGEGRSARGLSLNPLPSRDPSAHPPVLPPGPPGSGWDGAAPAARTLGEAGGGGPAGCASVGRGEERGTRRGTGGPERVQIGDRRRALLCSGLAVCSWGFFCAIRP